MSRHLDGPSAFVTISASCGELVGLSPLTWEIRQAFVALDGVATVVRERGLEDSIDMMLVNDLTARMNALRAAMRKAGQDEVEEVACPFDGDVEAAIYGSQVCWTCPVCGHEHEQDVV